MKHRLPLLFTFYFSIAFLVLQGLTVLWLYHHQKQQFHAQIPNELIMLREALEAQLTELDSHEAPMLIQLTHRMSEPVSTPQPLSPIPAPIQTQRKLLPASQLQSLLESARAKSHYDRLWLVSSTNTILADSDHSQTGQGATFPYVLMDNQTPDQSAAADLPFQSRFYHFNPIPFKVGDETFWLIAGANIDQRVRLLADHLAFKPTQISYLYQYINKPWEWFSTTQIPVEQQYQISESIRQAKPLTPIISNMNTLYGLFFTPQNPHASLILLFSFSPMSILHQLNTVLVIMGLVSLLTILMTGLLIAFFMGKLSQLFSDFSAIFTKVESGTLDEEMALVSPTDEPHPAPLPEIQSRQFSQFSDLFNHMLAHIRKRENELIFQNSHDPTTELPNIASCKRYLEKRLASGTENAARFGLVSIGIERFPQIIHTLGRPVSDRLLHHIAARLTTTLKSDFCCRLPGNIFLMVFTELSESTLETYAKQILTCFESPFSVYTVAIDVDALLGFSFCPKDGSDADGLLQKADVALYAAKQNPERYAVYDPAKDPRHFNKLSLMSELREGLSQNELEVYYQPKVSVQTGRIVQVEALARWNHPTKGFMSPGLFIPLAEETGHIKKLTLWLIEQSFEQCRLWHEQNLKIGVSLNLSVKDLLNNELIPYISNLLHNSPVEPKWFTLEITESAFMADPEHAMHAIRTLAGMGLQFSIDDFGTGYSSLSYLKKIPVHELKIDQSFIRDVTKDEKVGRLVDSTIHLGHSLDMIVVAEGIEDQAVYDQLKAYGCDIGQGYLFSKPLSSKDFLKWIHESPWGLSL